MNKTDDAIYVVGGNHEAMNACILLASLDKQVMCFAYDDDINQTLAHYKFDKQMTALWEMYVQTGSICAMPMDNDVIKDIANKQRVWLFVDEVSDHDLTIFVKKQDNLHSQIIVSGTKAMGEINKLAKQLKTAWVYYLPFIFMKDGANFSAFFGADLLIIGEKTADSVQACKILLFLQKNAKTCEVADIKTIEFARTSIMAMLATRLSFMNEMARLADNQHINICDIERIMGKDSRIGGAYLSAGWGFGGKALPTEIELLSKTFAQNQVNTQLLSAVRAINSDQKELIFRKFWRYFNGFIEHKTVVIWGAGYRIGTSRTTNSAIHELLNLLWSYQISTFVYVNNTAFELSKRYGDEPLLTLIDEPYTHLTQADGLFIVNWSGLLPPDIHELNKVNLPIFDAKNILTDSQVAQYKGDYIGIGRQL
ncbi:UDP-glucose 6-dehydrogenase [Moraxella nasovis]|uniref:UDP-glucose 6-dehydrogenase n=1 Tax=Moraxella nasovis TaxID=2904121 RepID=UPI001F619198|nr:UDP-glucose 6-dehydrogenase [Moraxella nasovis]UNU72608.1 UDP-glucose 6-dehydrogenase [Moraxella nasovis]